MVKSVHPLPTPLHDDEKEQDLQYSSYLIQLSSCRTYPLDAGGCVEYHHRYDHVLNLTEGIVIRQPLAVVRMTMVVTEHTGNAAERHCFLEECDDGDDDEMGGYT